MRVFQNNNANALVEFGHLSTEQYFCAIRYAIIVGELSDVSAIILQVFWLVRWWFWS